MNMIEHWPPRPGARRIQIFVSDLSATGVVRNAIAVANEAAASGYLVRLLTCNPDGPLRGQLGAGVTILKLNDAQDWRRSRRVQMQRALMAYRRHSRDWKPDIMLSAGNHGHLLSTMAWLGRPGLKILRISNDLSHGSPSLPTRLWRAAKFRLMAGLADRLVYVSRAQASHSLLARELSAGKAIVIPNGVDLEQVRSASKLPCDHIWATDPSVPIVLAVGRHVQQKNFQSLLMAFAEAAAQQPMRLIFLGDGKQEEIDRLKALATELGVDRDVDFVPPMANPFPLMAAAGTLVLPSLWEGSANVLLEAMACGTPVIASRTAGDADHVLDSGRFGVLIEPGDLSGLATALLRQTGPRPIVPRARATSFDRGRAMRDYVRLFDELADRRSRERLAPPARLQASAAARP